jgi:hypothetical protein
MAINPFVWDRPLDDLTKIVGMDDFARDVALMLKAQTNVAIFGARDTGKSTFISVLGRELALEHEADAPPYTMVRVDLKRALSIAAFISCVNPRAGGARTRDRVRLEGDQRRGPPRGAAG